MKRCIAFAASMLALLTFAHAALCADGPRIVSLSPTATEIIFDIGMGENVVGATTYCTWPPEAASIPRVGDAMNADLETIASISPDIALISDMNEHLARDLSKIGIASVAARGETFDDICASMLAIGEACGAYDAASKRVETLRAEARAAVPADLPGSSPSVLVVVGRDDVFSRVYAAGPQSFYDDILNACGARSAITNDVKYASLTREGLIAVDADIIIELTGDAESGGRSADEIASDWGGLRDVRACEEGNVRCIVGDFVMRAGPRYPAIVRAFAEVLRER